MKSRFGLLASGILGFCVAILFSGHAGFGQKAKNVVWKPIVSDSDSLKLAKMSVAIIVESAKDLATRKNLRKPEIYVLRGKIRVNGSLLAVFAKAAKPGSNQQELITLARLGLKICKTVADKDVGPPEIKKMAEELAKAKANPTAKLGEINWDDYFDDQGEVQRVFKRKAQGGNGIAPSLQTGRLKRPLNGIEEKIKALAKAPLTDAQLNTESEDLALLAHQIAALALLVEEWSRYVVGQKQQKDWERFSRDMGKSALRLAVAAKRGNANGVLVAGRQLNAACVRCHATRFRFRIKAGR